MSKKSKLQSAAITLAEIVLELRKADEVLLETILERIDVNYPRLKPGACHSKFRADS